MELSKIKASHTHDFLLGGGETGALIRSIDWSNTPLGSVDTWPQSLKTCIRIVMTSRQPMFVWWGKELINIYNDAYISIVGGKHPAAMGIPAREVWREIWDEVGPRAEKAMRDNEGTYDEALLLIMERNGYPEETYYTFSYSPVPADEGGIGGIICANTDDTQRIIGERQLRTLKDLGKNVLDCKANAEVYERTMQVLKENPQDFPFALIYQIEENGKLAHLFSKSVDDLPQSIAPDNILFDTDEETPWHLSAVVNSNQFQIIDLLKAKFNASLPSGAWSKPPDKALVIPVSQTDQSIPYAVMVIGLNPYRRFDEKYESFFRLITDQVATSINKVHAFEEERKRTEALLEIDRAKTTFFSNISHEFRTPLTLMLSPLADMLQDKELLTEPHRENVEVTHRNALRLLKLVNSLLDFSRIEAGRMQASFQLTDIATLTRDIASTFRSAIEKAGLEFIVNCQLTTPVYVDRDMWDKIVLNLLSNAFKYTTDGKITLHLQEENGKAILSVQDTGVGIPADQVDKVFERFHRVQHVKGRSQEGTGIGLSLVQELVKLHQGTISLRSELGKGSIFTVSIPLSKEHLHANTLVEKNISSDSSLSANAFVQEAMRWLPIEEKHATDIINDIAEPGMPLQLFGNKRLTQQAKPYVLLADDNADMRDYIKRLLKDKFDVVAVENGKQALEEVYRKAPDLVLSDVMMPEMDGFGLVKQLKSNSTTAGIPIILLSARAGEEATVEGLNAGADDYMVKPFSARELVMRIDANIRISKSRETAETNLRNIFMQSPFAITILTGKDFIIELANDRAIELWGKAPDQVMNKPFAEAFPELIEAGYTDILNKVCEHRERYIATDAPVTLIRNGAPETLYINFVYEPMIDADDNVTGVMGVGIDITSQVIARNKINEAEQRSRLAIEAAEMGTFEWIIENDEFIHSERLAEIYGYGKIIGLNHADFLAALHPEDYEKRNKAVAHAFSTGFLDYEGRLLWKDGSVHWVKTKGKVIFDENNVPLKMYGTSLDVTEQRNTTEALRQSEESFRELAQNLEERVQQRTNDLNEVNAELVRSNKELEQFAFITSHDLQEPLRKIQTFANLLSDKYASTLNENANSYINKITSASVRMSQLITDLLNFSRLRRTEGEFIATDLNNVLNEVRNDLEVVISNKKAIINAHTLPIVNAIPFQMNQLFYNLLSNALKFAASDRPLVIDISSKLLSPEEIDVRQGLSKRLSYCEITIKDNGIGFNQVYANKIFEIFQRLNNRSEYEGTGIGLALCNKIMINHSGLIFAKSQENIGSEFYVVLPIQTQAN